MAGTPDNPLPLSVAIICRDNDATIGLTLGSVRGIAAEIVAVDSGSTDGTLRLLEEAGARIVRADWPGHIAQKNRALDECAQPWVLSLDSDESLTPELERSIRDAVTRNDESVRAWELNRLVYWGGTGKGVALRHAWQPEWRLRLVRAGEARWGGYDPHDALELLAPARTGRLSGDLRHDAILGIAEFMERQVAHGRVAAQSLHARGARGSVRSLVASPVGAWCKMTIARRAYRDGWRGMVAASSVALAAIAKHAALLELSRGANDDRG